MEEISPPPPPFLCPFTLSCSEGELQTFSICCSGEYMPPAVKLRVRSIHQLLSTTLFSELLFLKMSERADKIVKGDLAIGTGGNQMMTDIIDRPGKAFAAGTYAGAGQFEDESEEETGVYAGAGVGHVRAEWSFFDAEAKGPNASAGAEISRAVGVRAIAKAELASASVSVGPVKATLGLAIDTGGSIGPSGIEAKVLGTGFSFGRTMGVSLFGTGFEIKLW
ncbi:uncharacterized protein LOC116059278 [Sander lucioperca]|nr:uncharacterized protein LOC116059278 [Sander lucioperca]